MAFDNNVVIVGNVTRDPELRYIPSGPPVTSFGVAWNQRSSQGGEEKAHFFDVTCWRELAENVAESISKGSRVVIYGRLDYRSWESENGEKRSAVQIVADEVSPSLRWATAEVTKTDRRADGGSGGGFGGSSGPASGGSTGGSGEPIPTDEEPF